MGVAVELITVWDRVGENVGVNSMAARGVADGDGVGVIVNVWVTEGVGEHVNVIVAVGVFVEPFTARTLIFCFGNGSFMTGGSVCTAPP